MHFAAFSGLLEQENCAVFFHARWSGPSASALMRLKQELKARGVAEEKLSVVDLDQEEAAYAFIEKEGYSIHGYGEAALLSRGKVRYFSVLAKDPKTVGQKVEDLLAELERGH